MLPCSHGEPSRSSLDLVCSLIRRRVQDNEPVSASELLTTHPELARDEASAIEVVMAEFLARRQAGESPDPPEWLARFPEWQKPLRRRFEEEGLLALSDIGEVTEIHRPSQAAACPALPALGPHTLICELGRGGMGVVHLAHDLTLDRRVALKMVRGGMASLSDRARFYREARAAARLSHPHIVPVLAMGTLNGEDCYAMPVYARSLAARLLEGRLGIEEAVGLMAQVARALHHAHEHGVIHRDLKPANILLDAQGSPALADFGLAWLVDGSAQATATQGTAGTPAYMAPELALGKEPGKPADLWALGIMLHEMLAGQRPFQAASTALLAEAIRDQRPPRLRSLRPEAPRGLEAVILKCLAKRPQSRYATAGQLADDLEALAEKRPVSAPMPPPPWLEGWFPQKAPAAALLGCLAVPLLLFAGLMAAPPAKESPEQAALRGMGQVLKAGKPLKLLGASGVPAYQSFRTEPERRPEPAVAGRAFQLTSRYRCQVELMPQVPLKRFRFSGEARLLGGNPLGKRCGLYVAGLEAWTGERLEFDFFALAFSDHGGKPRAIPSLIHLGNPDGKGQTSLSVSRCTAIKPGVLAAASLAGPNPFNALAAPLAWGQRGCAAGPWHRIDLEVSASEIVSRLDGQLVARCSLDLKKQPLGAFWRENHPAGHPMRGAPHPLKNTGRIGVYLVDGAAEFRNIVLVPLP